jgi:5'-methylthioadenosine phosphorylase
MSVKIGIIGGSGLYKMGIINDIEEISVDTPFGKPSDKITLGKIDNVDIAFLPRHGKGHTLAPHKVNYRANVFALKELGVEYLVSTAAVGSLKKEIKPCDFVIADQLIDRSFKRSTTFFEDGIVAHVGFADPFCKTLSDLAFEVVRSQGVTVHRGCYICMEGPQFSTRAESTLYRSWDVDVVGMTLAPEAKLAREAEMCLCGILTVTDYDCWYEGEKDVSVASVVENLKKNDTNIASIIKKLIPKIRYKRICECHTALEYGILTSPELLKKNADPRVAKVLLKRFIK